MKKYKCIKKIGPYDGPYNYNVITYLLTDNNNEIAWHSGPNKIFNFQVGLIYTGIKTKKYNNKIIIDYTNSNPKQIQLKLL